MAKNEIKLRRQLIDESVLQRHRDYSSLLKQHQVVKRKKRVRKFFIFTIIVAIVTVLMLILFSYLAVKWQKDRKQTSASFNTSLILQEKIISQL